MNLFVTCAHSLEPVLHKELVSMGYHQAKEDFRGVYIPNVTLKDIYKINYESRIAIRVLLPIKRFNVYNANSLYKEVKSIDWTQWVPSEATIAIDSHVSHPAFKNTLYAAQKTKDAICDQLREARGFRPDVNIKDPDVKLHLFIHNKKGTLSFDTSLIPLFKRGYRVETVRAPMPETLAAALLYLCQYKGESLADPFCGSGTLLIEAAWMATRTPPGLLREKWGFSSLPFHDTTLWEEVKHEALQKRIPLDTPLFWGFEIDPQHFEACKANISAAGMTNAIQLHQADMSKASSPFKTDWIFTNPPYGKRLTTHFTLYKSLGKLIRENSLKGAVLTSEPTLVQELRLKPDKTHHLKHSTEKTFLYQYTIFQKPAITA